MDPLCQNEDDNSSGFRGFLEHQFDMLIQEINNFQKTISPATNSKKPSNVVKSFTDLEFFTKGNNSELPEPTRHEFNRILLDFEAFENVMFPLNQADPMFAQNSDGLQLPGTSQNPIPIIKEKANVAGNSAMQGIGVSTKNAITTQSAGKYIGVTRSGVKYNRRESGSSSGGRMVTSFVKYANVSSCGVGSRGIEMVGDYLKKYGSSSSSRMAAWQQVGAQRMPKHPLRRKKRYKGVYKTEAEPILKHERLKIQRRLTAAQAYEKQKVIASQQVRDFVISILRTSRVPCPQIRKW